MSEKLTKIKKYLTIYAVILSILASFTLGLYVGKVKTPSFLKEDSQNLINTEENKPQNVDFSLFWDVWNEINDKYINQPVDQQALVYGAAKGLVSALQDPYSEFMDPTETQSFNSMLSGTFEGIGAEIAIKNNVLTIVAPLPESPAEKAGLKAGDQILKIDDTVTQELSVDEAVQKIRGSKGSIVTLTIYRENNGGPKEFKVTRDTIKVKSVKVEYKENNIAHITISSFNDDTVTELNKIADEIVAKKSPKIILDLRNNPGGLLDVAVNTATFFLEKNTVVVTEDYGDKQNIHKAKSNNKLKDIPLVVLQNEGSASASEILSGALKDNRQITIVGKTSFGKGSVQEFEQLKSNSSLRITVAKWLTPNGTQINQNGIKPDIEIDLTEEDFNNNRDPQLDKALEIIKTK
jgi:carboxyl-terminal processing protease